MKTLPPIRDDAECPEPGVYYGVPADEYHSWSAMNHSTINGFYESTAKGVHEIANPKESADMDFGNMFHTRFLEPDVYKDTYVIFDPSEGPVNPSTGEPYKSGSQKFQNWAIQFEDSLEDGKKIISREDHDRIESMIESIKRNPNALGFATGGYKKREMCIVWDEVFTISGEEISVRCKARIDMYIDKLGDPINLPAMLDLKTTRSAYYENFQRQVWDRGYHRQMAFYLRGLHVSGMMPSTHDHAAMILACEKEPPYQNAIYYINHPSIMQGIHEQKSNAVAYIKWRLTGDTPGLPEKPRPISIPVWQQMSANELNTTLIHGERL